MPFVVTPWFWINPARVSVSLRTLATMAETMKGRVSCVAWAQDVVPENHQI